MQPLRALLRRHRAFAMLVVAAALCLKLLVPAGYMLGDGGGSAKVLTVTICADAQGGSLSKQITIPGKAKADGHAKVEGACPYSSLSMAALGGADPLLLAGAVAFILALGFAPVRENRPATAAYLRPPLRGPPALA